MPDVRLVDLELIRRFSLAIRQESADAAELLRILEADRSTVEALLAPKPKRASKGTAKRRAASKASSTRAGSAKAGGRKAPAKKSGAAKAAGRRSAKRS